MRTRNLVCVSVLVAAFAVSVVNGQDKPASAIQKKDGDQWVDAKFDDIKECLVKGERVELRLRGWLTRINSPSDEGRAIWMLDSGAVSWILDLQENAKLQQSADRLKRQQVIVSGSSKYDTLGPDVKAWFPGVSVKSLARAKPDEPAVYIAELESQIERLYERLDQLSRFAGEREIDVQLPAASEAVALTTTSAITIIVQKDETILLDKKTVTHEQLKAALKRAVDSKPSQSVVIQSDRGVPFRKLTELLDICKQAGIQDVSVAVKSPE